MIIAVVALVVVLNPPTFDVTVYEVIGEPPLSAGADQEIPALVSPIVVATFVGAPGTVTGVTELLETDTVLVPNAFVAVTLKVYAVPFVRPVIVIGEVPPVAVIPVFEVTVYEVIADPPLLDGAVNETVALPFPATAETLVGASGAFAGVMLLLAVEAVLVPTPLTATTVKL